MRIATAVSARAGWYYGWWVVFASAGIVFLTGGTFFYGFGAMFNPIVDEFGWSRASVSFAFSLRSEVSGVAAPAVGFLVDRLGSRRLMLIGVAIVSLGFVLLSQIESLPAFYGAVIVIAIGMSATGGPVGMVAIAHWFRRQRGRALALMTVGAGTSGVMVLVLEGLITAFDWRSALLIMALVQLAVCIPLALSVRNTPEEMGLTIDDEPGGSLKAGETASAEGTAGRKNEANQGLTVRQALRTPAFWQLAVSVALGTMGATAIVVHQIPFLTNTVGTSGGIAAASVTVMTLISLIGRLGMGQLADVYAKRKVLAVSFAITGVSLLLFATVQEPWQVLYALPVFAIGFGGIIPVRPAFQAEYFGLKAFGAIQGIIFTVAMLGSLVGPVFAGYVYDETDSYRLAFVVLAGAALLAVPLILGAKRPPWPA